MGYPVPKTLVFHPVKNAKGFAKNFFAWQEAESRHSRQLRRLEGDETMWKKYRKEFVFFAGWNISSLKSKKGLLLSSLPLIRSQTSALPILSATLSPISAVVTIFVPGLPMSGVR